MRPGGTAPNRMWRRPHWPASLATAMSASTGCWPGRSDHSATFENLMRLLQLTHRVVATILTLGLLLLNLRLYWPNAAEYGSDTVGADVVPQLHFIGAALREGSGERMQAFFPEGFFF